jgi:hypothetical protein
MKTTIQVEPLDEGAFQVRVSEGATETSHRVTAKPEYVQRFSGGKVEHREIIRRAFEFLLEREPKESILARFDLKDIQRYFPDFEKEFQLRCSSTNASEIPESRA